MSKQSDLKKQHQAAVDSLMKEQGFIRLKASWIYVHSPHADSRLKWVFCYNFSHRGNLIFDILVGPAWEPSYFAPASFPGSVGYRHHLTPTGMGHQHTFQINRLGVFEYIARELIPQVALPYLREFDTPQHLLEREPDPILAQDIGEVELAIKLYGERIRMYYSSVNYEAGKSDKLSAHASLMLQGYQERFRAFLRAEGRESDFSKLDAQAEILAINDKISVIRRLEEHSGPSRWTTRQIKLAEQRLTVLQ